MNLIEFDHDLVAKEHQKRDSKIWLRDILKAAWALFAAETCKKSNRSIQVFPHALEEVEVGGDEVEQVRNEDFKENLRLLRLPKGVENGLL